MRTLRTVDTCSREELAELKSRYDEQKAKTRSALRSAMAAAPHNSEVLADLFAQQLEDNRSKYKNDLMRLARHHDMSVLEVQQSVDHSN
ncbi:hypothetical protein DIPPA_31962 [Diplonema papillatum]|nr:hypothetical protein DIPPA_31962 [Diplonema papillatum]